MKDWFKYEYGYVNVDADNVYFTNSGNWSETITLEEKGIQKSNSFRKTRIQLFLIISCLLFAGLIVKHLTSGGMSLLLVIGLPLGGYFLYHYLKSEIGGKFKLPITKIDAIEIENSTAIIHFFNAQNGKEEEVLKNVEEKGLRILKGLKESIG